MNRNIVTPSDVTNNEGNEGFGGEPPGTLTADDFWGRLLKYVPVEMISAYLIIYGILITAYDNGTDAQAKALGILLVVSMIATWFFAQRVLKVQRVAQLSLTVVAFVVWAFASGGWFATQDWWVGWMGTVAVVVFGIAVRIIALPPLPTPPAEP